MERKVKTKEYNDCVKDWNNLEVEDKIKYNGFWDFYEKWRLRK